VIYDSVKARTGRSPYNLVIEKRIERACAMLRDTDASIAEVACACGFSSQQHMYRNAVAPTRAHATPAAGRVVAMPIVVSASFRLLGILTQGPR
jgi:AraC family transcriptional regulator